MASLSFKDPQILCDSTDPCLMTINSQGGVDLHPLGTFLAPNGTTALTITAQQGNLLLLHDKAGKQVVFNLVSHQFQ